MSKRVSFSPEGYRETTPTTRKATVNLNKGNSREKKNLPVRFLRQIMARLVSNSERKRNSRKVSSSSSSAAAASLGRSRSYAECSSMDSQRAEAIEDCIEFLNSSSSSSLHRCSSVSSSCCN